MGMIVAGCGKKENGSRSRMAFQDAAGRIRLGAIPVKVVQVKREPISVFLLSSANLEALRKVDVVARVSGIVRRIFVEEGDAVQKNQILAKLDDSELQLQLQQAQARAENNSRLFQRAKDMFQKNLISKEQFDDAKYQYETAQAQLKSAQLQLSYASIRAPISGVVTQRLIEVGNTVNTNQKVFTMVDFDTLYARSKSLLDAHLPQASSLLLVNAEPVVSATRAVVTTFRHLLQGRNRFSPVCPHGYQFGTCAGAFTLRHLCTSSP
jgi:RND family efflux transporter MFP subunit